MPPPPPPRALPEEVVEEILIRLPPHKPAYLVRASLACKSWLALLSSARFRGRYREFHEAPPMLGVLISRPWDCLEPKEGDSVPPFISTTKFRVCIPDDGWGHRDYAVWDCRHGRVLLAEKKAAPMKLAVWDPMTGHQRELQEPGCMVVEHEDGLVAAAVVCAVSGCDHRACHDGPSRVVFFSLHHDDGARFVAQACVSFLETSDRSKPPCSDFNRGEWSEPCSGLPVDSIGFIQPNPPILVKDAIYFMLGYEYESDQVYDDTAWQQILKYDLSSNCLSLIDTPAGTAETFGDSILMALEDGSLGFARWKRLTLYIWSRHMCSDRVAEWTRHTAISLKDIPPVKNSPDFFRVLGSVEGSGIIFVYTKLGIYEINLNTLCWKKIWKRANFNALIPYMCFYNPQGMYRGGAMLGQNQAMARPAFYDLYTVLLLFTTVSTLFVTVSLLLARPAFEL